MLEIKSNGSKWYVQEPDTIETLIRVLNSDEPLDPTFEDYGNFVNPNPTWLKNEAREKYKGCTTFFGNFSKLSHGFSIITDEQYIVKALTKAINNNKQLPEYQELRKEYRASEQRKERARYLFSKNKISQKEMYEMMAGVI